MTLSVKIVRDMIENGEIDNIGFILTVIRDNCSCDYTYDLLDKLVNIMWQQDYKNSESR